ncbi:hypothetical protein [Streptomyces iconiensis]|uniref:Uncharacterized protein n=1 Tax=Streptomyces iconiensis TaxID=1384038 RepID=A0ABT7A9I7_9ACTN|nr:hypothetical protein [Streptomyces iconiensis]MDJ1137950.1 hypothetical protein [Streptomyces iconiensis]
MNVALSLGGVVVALAILWFNLRPWLKGGRDPKALIPYASGAGIGSLATICVGGLLGWGASGIAGLGSKAGDKGINGVTGTGSSAMATGRMGTLTEAGGAVTVLLLLGVIALFKAAGKNDKRRIAGGFVTFAILGFLPGIASLLGWWPDLVNAAGAKGREALEHAGSWL